MGGSGGHSSTHSTINAYKADMTQKISGPYFVPTSGQLAIGPAQNGGGSTPPGFNRHRVSVIKMFVINYFSARALWSEIWSVCKSFSFLSTIK